VLAYRLQEQSVGALSPLLARRLEKAIKDFEKGIELKPQSTSGALRPGSRLLRDWQGRTHEVIVLDSGFQHQDRTYQSLSEVARKITGTRWSGPLFFGLKTPRAKTDAASLLKRTYSVDLNGGAEVAHGL